MMTRELGAAIFMGIVIFFLLFMLYAVYEEGRQDDRMAESPLDIRIKQYENAIAAYPKAVRAAERTRQEAVRRAETARQEAVREVERTRQEAVRVRLEAERARKAAERAERRKLREHWESLRGVPFERELAALYRYFGYQVRSTPKSGDQGIDLILTKDGKTTIVQCKGQKGPASPAVVRELYGALVAFRADDAILACTGGFTRGVSDFVRDKPITLSPLQS